MTQRAALRQLFRVGSSKRVLKSQWQSEGVPFYRGREVTRLATDGFVKNELFISESLYEEFASQNGVPDADDIMVTAIGTIGNSYVVRKGDRFYFKDASVLWLKKTAEVNSEFINYWLKSDEFFGQLDRGNGATVDSLTIQKLQSLDINLPALPEQRRIVAILDDAFEGIATAKANAERNLKNAREVFESFLHGAYASRTGHLRSERLEELCVRDRPITYGVIKLGHPIVGGVPCLRTSNVRWLDIDTTGMKRIAASLSAEYSRTILRGGEVLVNVRGTLGGVAVVSDDMVGWNVSREVAVVPVNAARLDPAFAAFWIGSRTSQDWLSGVKKGAAYTGINIEDLRNLPVPLPQLSDQRAIVDDVVAVKEAARRMDEIYRRKLAALDELKQSLLHQAFSGALTSGKLAA